LIPVSFYTLGCKLNQLETEAVSSSFAGAAFTVVPWNSAGQNIAPLCVINTCTVTSKAEQKARRVVRQCLNAGAVVLVTGCYAQLDAGEIQAIGQEHKETSGALFVLPGKKKEKLLGLPAYLAETLGAFSLRTAIEHWLVNDAPPGNQHSGPDAASSPHYDKGPFAFNPARFSFHSRAFLKIQDGCDRACAYCRVPLARGKSISLSAEEVLARLQALEEVGMAEAVITGVNICQYLDPGSAGKNENARRLPSLLAFLLDNTQNIRLRLSSIEVEPELFGGASVLPDDFFGVFKNPRIRNHVHLSVQSGSDAVLAAMGRPYTARDILRTAEKIKTIRDDPFLACDIITGFPGESATDFEQTLALCRDADFAWIHAFPYSKRPGTRAAAITQGLVSQRIAGERVSVLLDMAANNRSAYVRRWLGKTVEAVAESPSDAPDATSKVPPFFSALTDNYVKVRVALNSVNEKQTPGKAFLCKLEKPAQDNYGSFDAWARFVRQNDFVGQNDFAGHNDVRV
jgi:threonylcarbamoyladenosine tRNA methylthiotransferase MtaB